MAVVLPHRYHVGVSGTMTVSIVFLEIFYRCTYSATWREILEGMLISHSCLFFDKDCSLMLKCSSSPILQQQFTLVRLLFSPVTKNERNIVSN